LNPRHSKQRIEEGDLKTAPPRETTGKTGYLAGGEVDKTSVSLLFSGDNLDPDEISKLLDCQPTKSYRKGDVLPDNRHRLSLDVYYVETRLIPVEPNFPGPSSGFDE
jgi:Domain of unknown function (DUF4279)